jgi:hypothetical protein
MKLSAEKEVVFLNCSALRTPVALVCEREDQNERCYLYTKTTDATLR